MVKGRGARNFINIGHAAKSRHAPPPVLTLELNDSEFRHQRKCCHRCGSTLLWRKRRTNPDSRGKFANGPEGNNAASPGYSRRQTGRERSPRDDSRRRKDNVPSSRGRAAGASSSSPCPTSEARGRAGDSPHLNRNRDARCHRRGAVASSRPSAPVRTIGAL